MDYATPRRSGAFFGRRKGHPLRPRQVALFKTLLPRLALDLSKTAPTDLRTLFKDVDDVRLARGPEFPSWTDSGPGKLRYGGRARDAGFEHVTRIELSQLALQFGASLPWGIRAQAQVNVQPDIADDYEPQLVEAFLRREWSGEASGWGLQAGLAGNPFSLEHTGPAWTPIRTGTACDPSRMASAARIIRPSPSSPPSGAPAVRMNFPPLGETSVARTHKLCRSAASSRRCQPRVS